MQTLYLWILLWIFLCMFWPVEVTDVCGKRSEHVQDTVHNGRRTDFYEYPWLAAVFITGDQAGLTFACGGTLISRNVVLTAAHCLYDRDNITKKVYKRDPEEIIVYLGRYHLLNWGDFDYSVAKEVKKIIVHDDYGDGKSQLNGDIALLVLQKPAAFSSKVQPVCLPDIEDNNNSHYSSFNGTVVGWGVDEVGNPYTSTPNAANSKLFLDDDECQKLIKLYSPKYFNKVMCAGYKDGKGHCYGDSGGGFYVEKTSANGERIYFVYGVLAKAFPRKDRNCDHSKLSIVTNVLHYLPWIQVNVDAESIVLNMKEEDKFAKEKLEKNMEQCCIQMYQEREYCTSQIELYEETKNDQDIEIKKLQTAKERILKLATIKFETATKIRETSKYEEAVTLYKQVTEIRKIYLGEDNKDTLSSMFETARTFTKFNHFHESLVLFKEVVERRNNTLGENNTDTLRVMQYEAWVLGQLMNYNQSLDLYNELIKKQLAIIGENHADTLLAMHNKAWVLGQLNNYNESLKLYDKVINGRKSVLGENNPNTLQSLHNKAWTLQKLGRYNESLHLYENVIKSRIQMLGLNDTSTLLSMHNKAGVLNDLGRYNESLAAYNEVFKLRVDTLGENHIDTLQSMHGKASVLRKLGLKNEAIALFQIVLEKMRLYNKVEGHWLRKSTENHLNYLTS